MKQSGPTYLDAAVEILLGDIEILQSHVRTLVTEEFYYSRKTDAGAEYLRSVRVSKLVGDNAGGNSHRGHNVLQGRTDSTN